jgi:iron complex transport system substrate-binding protein
VSGIGSPKRLAVRIALVALLVLPACVAAGGKRIVSLAPHLTELAFEAGIGDALVGAVAWSDHPAAAAALPRIGDAFRLDLERIVRLEATDALAWARGTPSQAIDELEALGVRVHVASTPTLDAIAATLVALGRLGGNARQGEAAAAAFRERRRALAARFGTGESAIPLFYQVSREPLFTLGRDHVINDVFALCGARNAFDDLAAAAAGVDVEAVLERDPLAIVASRAAPGEPAATAHWRDYEFLRAVRCDHLLEVDPALLVRPTTRLLDGAERLCRWLEERIRRAEDPACRTGRG